MIAIFQRRVSPQLTGLSLRLSYLFLVQFGDVASLNTVQKLRFDGFFLFIIHSTMTIWEPILHFSFVGKSSIIVENGTFSLLIAHDIIPYVGHPCHVLIPAFSIFLSLLEAPFVHSVGISQFSVSLKLIVYKLSFILEFFLVIIDGFFPNQCSFLSESILKSSFESVVGSFFNPLALEFIIFESTLIDDIARHILGTFVLGEIIDKFSFIIFSLVGDVESFSISFALFKLTDVIRSIFLVDSTIAIRFLYWRQMYIIFVELSLIHITVELDGGPRF